MLLAQTDDSHFFPPKISNKICSDQQSRLFLLRDIHAITNDNEISSVFISTGRKTTAFAPRSPSFLERESSWKPQDIIDFYTYPPRTTGLYMCTRGRGWTFVFRVRIHAYVSACLRREQRGLAVCHLLIGRRSMRARKKDATSLSAFPFQTRLDSPQAIQ